MKKLVLSLVPFLLTLMARAQHEHYVAPSDTLVKQKLSEWQDLKFGLLMHWGPYSQWGIVESWSICPEDEDWTQRTGPYGKSYNEYVKAYENLGTTFNPVNFDPQQWARAAGAAGMKYVIFTTKHHDGFCMFDTKQTDYKITGSRSPFKNDPRSNVARQIFDAFRGQNFWTGAYFSKPDWHSENYWWPYFTPRNRHVNYDPAKYPERWQAFKDYTYNQVQELVSEYGKMDILWLDGGWVRPLYPDEAKDECIRKTRFNQDIDMPKIAAMARRYQPGMLIVDRAVPGEYENYTTPEQQVPDKPLGYPWETCMTMANSWSYVPNDTYKSPEQLIHLLVKIVSRGGNFLLNIGPGPDGSWDPAAYARLKEIGNWMNWNSEGIYSSRPLAPYFSDNIYYTQHKSGRTWYAYYLNDSTGSPLPAQLTLKNLAAPNGTKITLWGQKKLALKWKTENGNTILTIPAGMAMQADKRYGVMIKMELPVNK